MVNGSDGRKKPRRFILDGKDRVFLDRRHHLTKTSPKALQAQDLLMGIAAAINADHTTDLTRLLRLPGTLNRKDQRNGREPVKAELIECDSNRRYSLDVFKNFAKSCEATKRQQQIEAMPYRPCESYRLVSPTNFPSLSLPARSLRMALVLRLTSLSVVMRFEMESRRMKFGIGCNR